jgi:glycine hydroxymethyltransferase
MLPKDTSAVKPSGIRLGVQELTRVGMKESEMKEVASLIHSVVAKKEAPLKVKEDVKLLKKDFTKIRFCFNEGEEAYRFYELV